MTTIPRKIFTVLIHNKEYDVYSIDGKEHDGYNDIPKTWWLFYSDRTEGDHVTDPNSRHWVPYSSSLQRRLWDIRIKQSNTSKEKWGDTNFRSHTSVEMWCNGKLIYQFGTGGRDMAFALSKVGYLQVILAEHPYNFFEPETEVGRKICWYGLPATIELGYDPGEIRIRPEYSDTLTRAMWWKELRRRKHKYTQIDEEWEDMEDEYTEESMASDVINWGDALSDEHIYWFRK